MRGGGGREGLWLGGGPAALVPSLSSFFCLPVVYLAFYVSRDGCTYVEAFFFPPYPVTVTMHVSGGVLLLTPHSRPTGPPNWECRGMVPSGSESARRGVRARPARPSHRCSRRGASSSALPPGPRLHGQLAPRRRGGGSKMRGPWPPAAPPPRQPWARQVAS